MLSPITARAALLQALMSGEGFGLELAERVSTQTGGSVHLHHGSIYPTLRDLERDGLASSWDAPGPSSRGGRPRRYYRLTAAGRRVAIADRETMMSLLEPALVTT